MKVWNQRRRQKNRWPKKGQLEISSNDAPKTTMTKNKLEVLVRYQFKCWFQTTMTKKKNKGPHVLFGLSMQPSNTFNKTTEYNLTMQRAAGWISLA